MKVHNILMPTDFSPCAEAALGHAIFLARRFRANIDLLHVDLPSDLAPDQDRAFVARSELREALHELAERGLAAEPGGDELPDVQLHEHLREGSHSAPPIVDYARETGADLIVMGTHGRRGFRRFLLGSIAEEVVRQAPCPVWTVRDETPPSAPRVIERIVVPYDFSSDARAALDTAADLARRFGAALSVVHVISLPVEPGMAAPVYSWMPSSPEVMRQVERELDRLVEPLRRDGLDVGTQVSTDYPATRIVEYTDDVKGDLIVIGSHGLTGIRRFFLGSVAERVIRSAPCPVLTLKLLIGPPNQDQAAKGSNSEA